MFTACNTIREHLNGAYPFDRDVNEARTLEAEARTLEAKARTLKAEVRTLEAEARTLEAEAKAEFKQFWPSELYKFRRPLKKFHQNLNVD